MDRFAVWSITLMMYVVVAPIFAIVRACEAPGMLWRAMSGWARERLEGREEPISFRVTYVEKRDDDVKEYRN